MVGSDGLVVQPAMWTDRGGRVEVSINPDTTSLTVKLTGARSIPTVQGTPSTNFQIALASDTSGSRYSTLRIVGKGVAYEQKKLTLRTGVPASQTGTEVGETTDNVFLRTLNQAYRAGIRSAVRFSGPVPSVSATISDPTRNLGFGTVAGSRLFSKDSQRYFRIRDSSISPGETSVSTEDDLLHRDIEGANTSKTYAQVQATRNGVTYRDNYLMGMR